MHAYDHVGGDYQDSCDDKHCHNYFLLSVLLTVYSIVASLHVPSMAVTTILTGVSNM
jgi:hypothetical protein